MTWPPGVTLCLCDVLEGLQGHRGQAQLVFADPPFNVGKVYSTSGDRRTDYSSWCETWIEAAFNAVGSRGVVAVMTLSKHLERILPAMATHGKFINLVPWRNVSAAHNKRSFWNSYQPIAIYGKTVDWKFDTYAERRWNMKTIGGHPSRWARGYQEKGQLLDSWDDIRYINGGNNVHPQAILKPGRKKSKAHPCQMPEGLAARLIRFFTDPGDTVIDAFAGSGTMMVAAHKLGRRVIGFEREKEYFTLIRNRFDVNTTMFEPQPKEE